MQNNPPLKPELVQLLNLEHHGYTHPEAVLVALEVAQADFVKDTNSSPGNVFSLGNIILQCMTRSNNNINLSDVDAEHVRTVLLQYENSGVFPDRIVHFNFSTGDKMVAISTFSNCSLNVGAYIIPCFATATLYLETQTILSVVFAHFH